MSLLKFATPTATARPGMKVHELFRECIRADVPGIPFRDSSGEIVGKASVRHVLKESFIPQFMVRHARLLGDRLEPLTIGEEKARLMLTLDVDEFVIEDMAVMGPRSSIIKALATMEERDTTYLFVIDEKGQYHGTISVMHVAGVIIEQFG